MKKITIVLAMVLMAGIFSASLVEAAEVRMYLKASYLDWTERISNSRREPFVKEYGVVYSVGGNITFHPTEKIFSRLELEGFAGQLDYSGDNISNGSFKDTNTNRIGGTLEETLGYKIKIYKDFYLSPFASLGISVWNRSECAETWLTAYGRFGLQAEKGMFFAKAGVLFPFYTEVHGGYTGISWVNGGQDTRVEVKPKGVTTPFAEIGLNFKKNWAVSFSYEARKWEESDRVSLGNGAYALQPATAQNLFSIKLEYTF